MGSERPMLDDYDCSGEQGDTEDNESADRRDSCRMSKIVSYLVGVEAGFCSHSAASILLLTFKNPSIWTGHSAPRR